jgi:uncharacterized protein (TIGR02217 family)
MIELPLLESLDVQTEIEFNNVILQDGAGEVCSIIQWQDALRTFNLSRGILYPPQRQELVDFFLSVKASGDAFLYKDKSDFKCRSLTTPYGSSTYGALYPITGNDYQICKAYSIGDTTYLRPISHPVNVIVYNGGIVQTGWALGDNGRITIPTAFDGIEFDFFVPVRFEEEDLSSAITASYKDNSRILYSLSKLVLKEKKILFDINPVDTFTPFSTHVLTLDLLKGQYIERVQERVTEQSSGFEVIERQENESIIELQQRKILRKSEMDYLIALWLCVKGDGGAFGFLKLDSSIVTARFITKALTYQFEAYFGDNEAVFNLGGLAIKESISIPCVPSSFNYSDAFNSGFNWSLQLVQYTGSNNSGNSSVSTEYVASGGNTGGYTQLRLDYGNVPASPVSGIRGYWLSPLFYTPVSNDEIITLDFSIDRIGVDKSGIVQYSPAVYFYTSINGNITIYETSSSYGGWATITLDNQSISSLVVGTPIYFGFAHGAGTNDAGALDPLFQTIGIDNFSVTVNIGCP